MSFFVDEDGEPYYGADLLEPKKFRNTKVRHNSRCEDCDERLSECECEPEEENEE